MKAIFPWLVLLLPLVATVVISLLTLSRRELSARLSIAAVVTAFWLSVLSFLDPEITSQVQEYGFTWLTAGTLKIDFGLRIDRLTQLMLVVVTAVGGAIQIYSYEYLREDRGFSRYFACLSLFTFAMLGVVLSSNFVQMFVFWELVGVSSYLLIGFWYERPAAADACRKAFLTNRVGDAGFLLGILLLWGTLGSVHFGELQVRLLDNPQALGAWSGVAGLLIFCGAMGKSAQFPLHVWLPDAMEGPTPVSALIHAATMVAAGVYMLCRVFFLYAATPQWPAAMAWLGSVTALDIMAWIGLITALLAALIALQQNDIKRILAYSTLSQLGYMVMAVGLAGPSPALFHLTTHAFFKALLFLGAGSVIYALHHEQDIWRMGGLRTRLPVTFWTFVVAALALCGLPPFSGFFSKDAILAQACEHNPLLFVLALLVSALTAFYMFRLVWVAFLRPGTHPDPGPVESPTLMIQPMLFLAVPAALLGFFGVEAFIGPSFSTESVAAWKPWYEQLFAPFAHAPLAAFAGLGAAGFGGYAAYELYRTANRDPLPDLLGGWARLLQNRFYLDELYQKLILPIQEAAAWLADGFDRWIIAGLAVGTVRESTDFVGRVLRIVQTGHLQTYAFLFVTGVLVWVGWALLR